MPIVLKNIRLSNDILTTEVVECSTGINGFVNVSREKKIPFVTLEFADLISGQKAIRRYFMKKNTKTGEYDQWDGKSPKELKYLIGVKLPGKFVTKNGITICLFEHELNSQSTIDKLFENEAYLGFDIVENTGSLMPETQLPNNKQADTKTIEVDKIATPINENESKGVTNVTYAESKQNGKSKFLAPVGSIILILALVIFLFSAINGALNGLYDTLISIPAWLRIALFVLLSLLIGGGFINRAKNNNN